MRMSTANRPDRGKRERVRGCEFELSTTAWYGSTGRKVSDIKHQCINILHAPLTGISSVWQLGRPGSEVDRGVLELRVVMWRSPATSGRRLNPSFITTFGRRHD